MRQAIHQNDKWYCVKCGHRIEAPHDLTAGGADSNYSKGAAAEFDYPATIECEDCGAEYCDGDLVEYLENGDIDMSEKMENNTIVAALLDAQAVMKHAELDSENPHFQSKYASLKSVIDAVRGPLLDAGLTFLQSSEVVEGGVQITTTLLHESGETLSGGPVFVPADKGTAHGYGSALTYAKRYSLALVCGISADNDDDANASVHDLVDYNQNVRELWDSIVAIKEGIQQNEYATAAEAWYELTEQQKRGLWVAPTKGGIFTTAERNIMKSDEFKKAHFGERG